METFTNVIQSPMKHPGQADHHLKGHWNTAFFQTDQPLILELGCGKGEYAVSLARFLPQNNLIGVDIKGSRMWEGARLATEDRIANVGFLRTSIEIIDTFFAEGEVQQIWITFPDPQMKSTRRRITATNFMEKYRRILAPGGIVHLKTDSNFQYRYTLEMVRENGFEIVANTENLYQSQLLNNVLSIQTFYEKQWRERGIDIKYLAFRLSHHEPLREPNVEIEKDPYRSFGRSARE